MSKELKELIFPEELLDIFEVVSHDKTEKGHVFYLDEKENIPEGYDRSDLESKGFKDAVSVIDFPLRGKPVEHRLRRRKWLVKAEGKIISKRYKIYANGTRKTEEFAAFLKELNRYYTS
jgi:hypothetical protein